VDDRPTVKLTRSSIVADGFESALISVVDKNNNDITGQCVVTMNNLAINSFEYFTTTTGSYTVRAKLGSKESLPVTLTATSPGASKYSQKVLVDDFTGTWCGWCPRVALSLDQISNTNPRVIPVAVHNGDAMAHPLEGQIRAAWGINAWPTALVNRKYQWNEQASVLTGETNKWSALGLAIESSITGNTITGKVKTEFDVTTSLPLTVCILLVEDGIVLPQRNFYNTNASSPFFGMGDPITGYVHNHTLRKFATNIFGDAIPTASQVKGSMYEKTFSFDATGYNLSKCSIIAFTGYSQGVPNRSGALNVQMVKAGLNQSFD
jgi:thiol-disulfide isomerase/thioredoxin